MPRKKKKTFIHLKYIKVQNYQVDLTTSIKRVVTVDFQVKTTGNNI